MRNREGRNARTYKSWCAAKSRCFNPRRHDYQKYGARGVTMCDRWRNSFAAFLEDMGERPAGTTIDRLNSDGNYEPGNCRWSTPREQSANIRTNVRIATPDGRVLLQTELARLLGIRDCVVFKARKRPDFQSWLAARLPQEAA